MSITFVKEFVLPLTLFSLDYCVRYTQQPTILSHCVKYTQQPTITIKILTIEALAVIQLLTVEVLDMT